MYLGVGAPSSSKFTHWLCYGDADSEVITVLYHTFSLAYVGLQVHGLHVKGQ